MAETNKVGVEFYATTAAAVSEVQNLTASVREQTTAATVAGSAQEQLGKDVAATRIKQLEATEAVRAAKAALDTHNQTVAAFGGRSREAAASAEKLAAAEREAAKAAQVAAEALQKTAAEVKAVAAAEDGQLSPATKRAAAQVAKMGETAQKTSADLQRMELQQKKGSAGFDVMGMASGKLMSVLGPAALGGTLLAVAGWIGDASAATLQYETAIGNLPFALTGAQAATRGLMSESKLAVAASQALALGVVKTEAEFNQLASDAAKIALKLGTSTDQMLGDLTTALGRGSAMILDNAGILLKVSDANEAYAASVGKTVAELDEAEKKLAFQTAAMAAIRKSADETTVAYDSNAAAVARLKVATGDLWDEFERGSVNAVGWLMKGTYGGNSSLGLIDGLVLAQQEMAATKQAASELAATMAQAWSPAFTSGAAATANWAADLLVTSDALEQFQRILTDPTNLAAAEAANEAERQKRDLLGEEAAYAERMAKALESVEKSNTSFLEAQAIHQVTYGPQEAPKTKKPGKKKKAGEMLDPGDVRIARTFDGVEQTELVADAAPEAAAAGVAEQQAAIFEQRQLLADREIELLDAQTARETERIDSIIFGVEVESEAEARRAELQDQRLRREAEYARWQVRSARTDAQREQAQTRLEEVEHRKRLAGIARAQADEARVLAQRQRVADAVVGHVTAAGGAILDATVAAINGQRGALAQGLSDFAAGQAKEFGLRALGEFARAAISAASYDFVGAAAHASAGGMALGVAAAAGGAAVGLGAAANSAGGSQGGRPPTAGPSQGLSPTNARGGTAAPMGGERERLERQDVPISYREPTTGPAVVIHIGTYVGGKDSAKGLAAEVDRAMTRHKAQGARP